MMRNQVITLLLVSSLMACKRESADPAPIDSLEATGIFGRWEIVDEVINGAISDMLPRCCEFLEFSPDDNITDYKGMLNYTDPDGVVNRGTFEVDITNQTLLFIDDDNDEFFFKYSVDDSRKNLTIDFKEDGINYTQSWIRIE